MNYIIIIKSVYRDFSFANEEVKVIFHVGGIKKTGTFTLSLLLQYKYYSKIISNQILDISA